MEDIFEKLKNLSNVAIGHLMTNNNTKKEIEEGKEMLVNVSYSIREALEKDMESEIMIAAIDSVVGKEYTRENPESKLPNDQESRDKIMAEWIEKKGFGYLRDKKQEARKKLEQEANKMDFLIKKADEGIAAKEEEGKEEMWKTIKEIIGKKIEPVLEKQLGKMAQYDFKSLLKKMKNEKKDGQYLFFEPKGWSKKGVAKSFPRKKGGRRTRKRKKRTRKRRGGSGQEWNDFFADTLTILEGVYINNIIRSDGLDPIRDGEMIQEYIRIFVECASHALNIILRQMDIDNEEFNTTNKERRRTQLLEQIRIKMEQIRNEINQREILRAELLSARQVVFPKTNYKAMGPKRKQGGKRRKRNLKKRTKRRRGSKSRRRR
tara:strand:- start:1807 stop:2934 length:1128 start_codon:yes stop_codon:yes gene_type:complete